MKIDEHGIKYWRNDKWELHREDGPAIEYPNGRKEWYYNGKPHREDGPAIEYPDGHKSWWINGELHRLDGPAVEWNSGTKEYYINGKRHRDDGPAIEYASGNKSWYLNGKLHREEEFKIKVAEMNKNKPTKVDSGKNKYWKNDKGQFHREDGPAYEGYNGYKEWWINGKRHREDGPAVEYPNGTKEWWVDGQHHRIDGPAVEWANGSKEWWVNGVFHREDGPACEYADGSKYWWVNGEFHREDGPAMELATGYKAWYLNGKEYIEEEFKIKVAEMNKNKLTEVDSGRNKYWKNDKGQYHRLDGPAIEYTNGSKEWWVNGNLHRIDGPAVEWANGSKSWYINGQLHREDGPAVENAYGYKSWYLNGQLHREEEFKIKVEKMNKEKNIESSKVNYILSVNDHQSVTLKPTSPAPILKIKFDPDKFTYTLYEIGIENPIVGINLQDCLNKVGIDLDDIIHLERRLVFTTDNDGFSKLNSVTKNGDVQLNGIGYKFDSLKKEYNVLTKNNPFSLNEKVSAPTDVLARFKLLEIEPFLDFFNITPEELDSLITTGSVIIKSDPLNKNGSYYKDIFDDNIIKKHEDALYLSETDDEIDDEIDEEFDTDELEEEEYEDEYFEDEYDLPSISNIVTGSVSGARKVESVKVKVESVNPEPKKETTMSFLENVKADKTAGVAANAVTTGLKLAGARQASRTIADIIGGIVETLMEKAGYKEYISLIHTDLGRAILEMSAPVLLHMALQQGIIPVSKYNEKLEAVARWAIEANTQKYTMEYADKVGDFIKAALTDPNTQSNLKSLIKLSSALSQAESGNTSALEAITNPMAALDSLFAEAEEVKR